MNALFRRRLDKTLKQKGISQRRAAQLIGVSNTTINGWLNGTRNPTPQRLRALSSALNVDYTWLLGR